MSNQVPIYSQVVPKSQQQQRQSTRQAAQQGQSLSPHTPRVFSSLRYDPRTPQPGITDPSFDPLNHNHGGNFGHFAANHGADLSRVEKFARESARRSARELGTGGGGRSELTSGGRQGRRERPGGAHVKQAEHKVNLRALSLNENAAAARANAYDRTPTEFVGLVNPYRDERTSRDYIPKDPPPPYRERDIRDCYDIAREHIISKENSKNSLSICHESSREITSGKLVNNCGKELSGRLVSKEISSHSLSTRENINKSSGREVAKLTKENLRDFSACRDAIYENEGGLRGCPMQPEIFVPDAGNRVHSMKKSSSANKIGTVTSGEKRKFYCREWAFQKLAHCLEQRPVSKTCGALILGDAGSGKTTLCKELSQPGTGPSARQQRALQRRMIARHFLQGQNEASLTISEFIRTLVMQILNHSTEHRKSGLNTTAQSIPEESKKDESAPSAPPLEECSLMRTDQGGEGEGKDKDRERRLHSTMERIHEKEDYDDMVADIVERRLKVSLALDDDPKQLPAKINNTNPFLPNFQSPGDKEQKLYENHENLFLRNASQFSKENRNSRLFRQQSEPPLSDKKSIILQKSLSTDSKNQRNSSEIDERSLAPCLSFEDAKPSSASKSLFKEILEADEYNKERKNSDGSDSKDTKNPLSPGGNNTTSNSSKVSRIPVASFKYPNMSVLSSAENSPSKSRLNRDTEKNSASDNSDNKDANSKSDSKHNVSSDSGKCDEVVEPKPTALEEELPEYQNILKPPNCPKQLSPKIGKIEDFGLRDFRNLNETLLNSPDFDPGFNVPTKNNVNDKNAPSPVKNTDDMNDDVPPPIPSLPVNPRTVIANSYYEKLLSEPEIQQALLLHNLEKNPDDCFKKALLFPLLEIDPPKQCLFLLVDSIDETPLTGSSMSNSTLTKEREKNGSDSGNLATRSVNSSKTIAELLANHHHLFPQWLLLVCTARKQSKYLTKMFTGFRKISLDDLRRGHVTLDVQRYILGRLDSEPRLAQHVSRDAAQALDHLRIKSNGCFLYLERVLDGLADGSVALREIREIPGTLNGLYMWLCQRLFHQRKFAKVQPLLNVLLVAKCGVDSEMLYQCMLTINHTITREDFNKRLHLLRRILTLDSSTGVLQIFHHSFSEWLLDVKHCTRRFLCSEAQGHAALAMYYTLKGPSLSAQDVHRLVLHITRLEQHLNRSSKSTMDASVGPQMEKSVMPDGLDLHSIILLWVLDSGCDVRASLRKQQQAMQQSTQVVENQTVDIPEFLNTIIGQTLPRDSRVLRALLEMGAQLEAVLPTQPASVKTSQADASVQADREDPDIRASQISLEQLLMLEAEDEEEESLCFRQEALELFMIDPVVGRAPIHTLAQHGDQLAIQTALQAYKSAGGDMSPDVIDIADRAGQTALQLAARGGRPMAVAALLAAGADAGRPDPEGWTPLRAAAWAGHTDVVELLLKHGCEVDCVDSDHRTALRAAAWSGHEEIVRLLIAHGADVNKTDLEGRTALIAAAYMGHTDIVTHLLDHGADIDHADADGRTALAVAALCSAGGGGGGVGGGAGGGGGCTQLLLERGANPTRADKDGMTPLLVAAFEGHKEVIELLLEAEADPEVADRAGRTPLWAAAAAGHAGAVRALLFWGCCVDTIDRDGRTVLSVAAAQGNKDVVGQLVDRGLDEHHRDNAGWTPLHYAAFEGHVEVCDVLLEAGAKVDENDNDGKGPLMLAAQEGHCRLMELLIDEWGAPVDQHSHDGKTALRVAALEGHYEAVRILVERGACVDALDADQRSTLYILALDNRLSMARYLIQRAGADVETRDSEGRTPLHVSAWQGHYEMVNLLLTVGNCNIDARDCERRTPLHSASWRGQSTVVRLLLSKGADPNAQCDQGATPLGIASQEGHEECVLWLLQHGANPKHSDHCGRTPAKVALRAGHLHVVRLLEHWGATPGITQNLQPDVAITNTNDNKASLGVTRLSPIPNAGHNQGSPDSKRRSVHSSNSTKSSSNLTSSTMSSSHQDNATCAQHTPIPPPPPHARPLTNTSNTPHQEPANRSGLALTFAQQVARCGRRGGGGGGATTSPLYATPPHSPLSDVCSPTNPPQHQLGILSTIVQQFSSNQSGQTNTNNSNADRHFCRDTHMRIILGRENKHSPPTAGEQRESGNTATNAVQSSRISCRKIVGSIGKIARRKKSSSPIVGGKSKRNGIVTNPAMRLVANVRNGLDNAAANLRRTGVALAASASSNNPAVKTNAFQWRRETPL